LLDAVEIARQISHPNVCRVYDVGDVDGRGRRRSTLQIRKKKP
jgi:hypothetical protein